MIDRIWHGWTAPQNADKYEALLKEEIFIGIQNPHIPGFQGIQLLCREVNDEIEFMTIMMFESLDAVREFAGKITKLRLFPSKREGYYRALMNVRNTMKSESERKHMNIHSEALEQRQLRTRAMRVQPK